MARQLSLPVQTPSRADVRLETPLGLRLWNFTGSSLVNLLAFLLIAVYLFPMTYMVATSLKDEEQFLVYGSPLYPAQAETYTWQGQEYAVYRVPIDGEVRSLALVKAGRKESQFIDPANPTAGPFAWTGQWRTLERATHFQLAFDNYASIWKGMNFPRLIRNTLSLALITEIGVLISSIMVAYGFSRFPVPGGKWLFMLLIATIMIPDKITLIPTYYLYLKLGWIGSTLPLIIPHLFGNAIFIFLLRQNFRSIPREMDEAAMLDGAGPLRTLFSVILPQSYPVVITVMLLHFFYIWNETRNASLYLGTRMDLQTVSFGISNPQSAFPVPNILQASALLVMFVPVLVLFLTQRVFMRNVIVTGTEK